MRIGVDFSGVVIDSDVAKVTAARRFFDLALNPANTTQTIEGEPISLETRIKLMSLLFCTSELLSAPPIEGAIEYISRLQAHGASLTVVSNINPAGVTFAGQWMRTQEIHEMEFVSVGIGSPKTNWHMREFDIFIDDKIANLTDVRDVVPLRILFSRPYNKTEAIPAGIVRAQNWQDVFYYAKSFTRSTKSIKN